MSPETVNAAPTKRFFIENFTRDLTLEDVVLDLIDNSIDSFLRDRQVELTLNTLLNSSSVFINDEIGQISLKVSTDRFVIQDFCGGIDINHAKNDVFRFGRTSNEISSALGVYGIGLKRAIFKIGKKIKIESKTINNGFRVDIDVNEWMKDDDYWKFELTPQNKAKSESEAGTTIIIERIHTDISARISDPTFLKNLSVFIGDSYSMFLNRYIKVVLNEKIIDPSKLPITISKEITPARQEYKFDGVDIELIAGLSDRRYGWNTENAGWYIICNGRVVVNADKTTLTGWGNFGPQFHSKFRGFVGFAFFFSEDPSKLPWTTSKRGLNVESIAYQKARKEMAIISRPVFNFLNNMYANEETEEIEERKLVDKLEHIDIHEIRTKPPSFFEAKVPKTTRSNTITVTFKAEKSDIEKIRKRINKPKESASNIGKYTFEYFIKNECVQ